MSIKKNIFKSQILGNTGTKGCYFNEPPATSNWTPSGPPWGNFMDPPMNQTWSNKVIPAPFSSLVRINMVCLSITMFLHCVLHILPTSQIHVKFLNEYVKVILTLKAPRKKCIWKFHLLQINAKHYWQTKNRSKQLGPRSDCSYRNSLIWVHTVCHRGFLNISADDFCWDWCLRVKRNLNI